MRQGRSLKDISPSDNADNLSFVEDGNTFDP
jgi:hypothetical protein